MPTALAKCRPDRGYASLSTFTEPPSPVTPLQTPSAPSDEPSPDPIFEVSRECIAVSLCRTNRPSSAWSDKDGSWTYGGPAVKGTTDGGPFHAAPETIAGAFSGSSEVLMAA